MRGIFLKIYVGILVSLVLIISLVYLGYSQWNAYRLNQYLVAQTAGTVQLIIEGLNRHTGAKREEWLALSRRVTELKIEWAAPNEYQQVETISEENTQLSFQTRFNPSNKKTLNNALYNADTPYEHPIPEQPQLVIWARLTDPDDHPIKITLVENSVGEQLMRGSKLLILNHLGLFQKAQRKQQLDKLSPLFGFPLQWLTSEDLKVNYLQKRALQRGDSVVDYTQLPDGSIALTMTSPIGNSGDFLQLGPLPLYDKYPQSVMFLLGLLSLMLLSVITYLLIRPLQVRLTRMATEVDAMTKEGSTTLVTVEGNDSLTLLAEKTNQMSLHIGRLLNAQKELNRAVSHELKTPLAKLVFHRELALQKLTKLSANPEDKDKIGKHLVDMQGNISELNTLVEEILFYASLDNTALKLNKSIVLVDALLDEVFESQRYFGPTLNYRRHIPAGSIVFADKYYLKRVLENLISNAQRYAQREIHLSVQLTTTQIMIFVEDDGPGIPPSQWPYVFEPFYRVEGNESDSGTGLGLSIVSKITRAHGGSVSINNSHLGGVLFEVVLPLGMLPYEQHTLPTIHSTFSSRDVTVN